MTLLKEKRTIVYIAHPTLGTSTSQQFLVQSGKTLTTEVTYVDLQSEFKANNQHFDVAYERQRLSQYDHIIFQFQLYWYQAPAVMKLWLDQVFDMSDEMYQLKSELRGKSFGIVVIAGVKASEYQLGGREGVTISQLLSPYYAWANHFQLAVHNYFAIHQFQYMSEEEKQWLMIQYANYLVSGTVDQFDQLQTFVIAQLRRMGKAQIELDEVAQQLFQQFIAELENQQQELEELNDMVSGK